MLYRFVLALFLLGSLSLTATAQQQWIYKAHDGGAGGESKEVTLVITKRPNPSGPGYEVTGSYKARDGQVYALRGTYTPQNGKLVARAYTDKGVAIAALTGLRRQKQDSFQIEIDQATMVAKRSAPDPSSSGIPDVSGTWNSSLGAIYEIKQNSSKFSWTTAKYSERAGGNITTSGVNASWSGGNGSGSATGTVETDKSGRATKIRWTNGVIFTKE